MIKARGLCSLSFSIITLAVSLSNPVWAADSVTLVGAGDIAGCGSEKDMETSLLLDSIPGTIFTVGDNAYPDGTAEEFADCYDPSWGRHKSRTRPSPGNHDYHITDATGYYDYFGAAAGDPTKGYYSYDSGDWHIVVLNTECSDVGGCKIDSPQGQWLQADLLANPKACTLAYWHRPRFSSDDHHGSSSSYRDLWSILYEAEADVILNGHAHVYERFAPQDPDGVADPARGIRQFIVGTGGSGLSGFTTPEPNSEVREGNTHGVLKLTLHANSYDWDFIPVAGQTFTDSGSAFCVSDQAQEPTVVRSSPADGSTFAVGDAIEFAATASDAQGLDLSGDLIWTSDIDGIVGVGGAFSTTLSPAVHSFIAEVTDSQGITASNAFEVMVTAKSNTNPLVTITNPADGSVLTSGDGVELIGTAVDAEDGDISASLSWVSDKDGDLGIGAPVSSLTAGTHVITASVTDSGNLEGSSSIDTTVLPADEGGTTLDVSVNSGLDDAEESADGSMYLNSSDLELVSDGSSLKFQVVGMRFAGIAIPQGAMVIDAYMQFTVDESSVGSSALTISGEASDDALAFSSTTHDISSRPNTAAVIGWSPVDWNSVGAAGPDQRTPNLRSLVQEIVSRPGWNPGNAMVMVIRGSGTRNAVSYNGNTTAAPQLHIVYANDLPNSPPEVDAGVEQSVEIDDGVLLQGSVNDDGLPNPPGVTSVTWNQVSGPGSVVFSSPGSAVTSASFSMAGSYTLKLTADDGALQTSDSMSVTVSDSPVIDDPTTVTFDVRVGARSDDAEESTSGSMSLTSSDLELVSDGSSIRLQTIGLRFNAVSVPPGATITSAYLQFQADEADTRSTNLTIQGEASINGATFSSSSGNISLRPRTGSAVNWSPQPWTVVGEAGANQRTPDIAPVIQEVVDQSSWNDGNSLVIIITGSGERTAESYDGSSSSAPLLHVEYQSGN